MECILFLMCIFLNYILLKKNNVYNKKGIRYSIFQQINKILRLFYESFNEKEFMDIMNADLIKVFFLNISTNKLLNW